MLTYRAPHDQEPGSTQVSLGHALRAFSLKTKGRVCVTSRTFHPLGSSPSVCMEKINEIVNFVS